MSKSSIIKSFKNTFKGLNFLIKNERNFKIHIVGLVVNLGLLYYFPVALWEIVIILIACFLVLIMEAVNTAIEHICNFIQPQYDRKIDIIKDIAAAAVLLSVIIAIIIGTCVYWKYIF